MLDPDVDWTSDGGGRATAARKPLRGASRVFERQTFRSGSSRSHATCTTTSSASLTDPSIR